MQRIGIVGAGRFGSALAEALAQDGAEVLLLDSSGEKIKRMAALVAKAVQGDATNADALTEAGMTECDAVVVAIGANMEASVLATMTLKELGIAQVVAKAASDVHGKVLERIGADQVVYPNRELARRLALALRAPTVRDYFEMADGVSVMELEAPERLVGKTLAQADVRNVLGVTVVSLRREQDGQQENIVDPPGDTTIRQGDTLTVFGSADSIEKLRK